MKLKIRSIIDYGHKSERIIIDVIQDTDIGKYLILDSTYKAPGLISNKVRHHPYWFPDLKVKKGDTIILHTRKGVRCSKTTDGDHKEHCFYWGLDSNIWTNDGDCAIVMHTGDWHSYMVSIPKTYKEEYKE
jgi:hypothetical protein